MDGVVVLESLELVVDGVEGDVVAEKPVDRIAAREPARAVVIHVLHGQNAEEDHRRHRRHVADDERDQAAQELPNEGVDEVEVLPAVGVGHHHIVVHGMYVLVQELDLVRPPVPEVLPRVQDQHRHGHLPHPLKQRFRLRVHSAAHHLPQVLYHRLRR